MRILVTGGAGYIGSVMTDVLQDAELGRSGAGVCINYMLIRRWGT